MTLMGRIKNRLWVRKDNPLILTGKEEKSYTIHTDERIEISLTSMEYTVKEQDTYIRNLLIRR